ncbi:MAG: YgiW/YdeI family stress tolerance OB fold protein [Elusimicrobiota bacterium]|nr:YgiW/YdeI family stress tolerance OB fold protein [Elusimicrobiota bacterium]
MKQKFLVCLTMVSMLSVVTISAQEGYQGPGAAQGSNAVQGYQGPGANTITTVAQAKNFRDDTWVVLRGKIDRFLGDEHYVFSDDSGNITIDIDRKLWRGLSVNQNDVVEISGKVDKDFAAKIEIDVKNIRKIQKN